jgi:hypothetical protein
LISLACSPEITSTLPDALTPRSFPGFLPSTVSEAFGRATAMRAFRLFEDVPTNKLPLSKS